MKVGVQTWGSDGDIRPMVALSGALRALGHRVTLAVTSIDNKDYTPLAEALDFDIIHIGGPFTPPNGDDMARFMRGDPLKQLKFVLGKYFDPETDAMFDAARKLCAQNDLLTGYFAMHPLKTAAELAGKPYAAVHLMHHSIPSRHAPPFPAPDLGETINPYVWSLFNFIVSRSLNPAVNGLRTKVGAAPVKKIMGDAWSSEWLNLVAVSPELCNGRPDWEGRYDVCGFFNMQQNSEEWRPPADLAAFLDAGEPPVYFTFGTMTSMDVDKATRLMFDAAVASGIRAIVQSLWDEAPGEYPDHPDVFKVDKTPHQHIFPKCSAIVHHGGAGTTQSALRAGVPSVAVTYGLDQPFWGSELYRIGVAGKPLNRWKTTAEKIGRAVREVTADTAMRKRAEEAGRAVREEQGAAKAAGLIEQRYYERFVST